MRFIRQLLSSKLVDFAVRSITGMWLVLISDFRHRQSVKKRKNKFNTMNGRFIKAQVTSMLEEGISRKEVVDYFYNAGMWGHFLWGSSPREKVENLVDEIIEINKEATQARRGLKLLYIQRILRKQDNLVGRLRGLPPRL